MTLEPINRKKICEALIEFRKNYAGSQRDFCKTMDINDSAFSQLKTAIREGKAFDRLISDDKLVIIGRKLQVNFSSAAPWKVVHTETFDFVTAILEACKEISGARIFCDLADMGKTTAAKQFMISQQNVFYVDCSQYKSRTEFVREMARVVGVRDTGSLKDVYRNTIYMLHAMDRPLIILDEAGDLTYPAFLEIKSYWNALEGACGWVMMGADGLAKKIDNNVECRKVGYTEILRRFGGEYMQASPNKKETAEIVLFRKRHTLAMAEHNVPAGVDVKIVTKGTLSMTRVKENIRKAERGDLFSQNKDAA